LHFLIPEKIDFNKGSYDASKRNFATAGSINLRIKNQLDGSITKIEYGQFNRFRTVALVDLLGKKKRIKKPTLDQNGRVPTVSSKFRRTLNA
jgi:hypothetical protein